MTASRWNPRRRIAALYAAAWLPFVLLYSGVIYFMVSGAMPLRIALWVGVENALVPAVLGIGIWWLTKLLPWPERNLTAFGAFHLVGGVAFALALTWWEYVIMGDAGRARSTPYVIAHIVLPWQGVIGLLLYVAIAAVSYSIRGALGVRDLRLVAERAERLRAQAELAALRAHINPHFLFNTLHSVTQLLRAEPARAEAALERLSDLFRYVLRLDRHGVELVSLEDEWQFTGSYLWLEQLRMGARLTVDAQLDDDALECAVPPFTLQPLVENAVRHGLGPKREGGTLRLRAHDREGTLVIEVSDDGVGADPAALADGVGIGVRAVRQRLEARHGARAGAKVSSQLGQGFRVTLSLPAQAPPVNGHSSLP